MPKSIQHKINYSYQFTICTLVTNLTEYMEMVNSFIDGGFTESICEYIYVDNTKGNSYDAYSGFNNCLHQAQGKYIIFCHQDVLLKHHNYQTLHLRIQQMDAIDPQWAILANAGSVNLKYKITHVTMGDGKEQLEQDLPLKIQSIDENFFLVKSSANLSFSSDLKGFHMYGTDLVFIANILGYTAWAIDFNLIHKSPGKVDQSFYFAKSAFIKKYSKAYKNRFIRTTITSLYVSGISAFNKLGNTKLVLFLARTWYKLSTKKQDYLGKA